MSNQKRDTSGKPPCPTCGYDHSKVTESGRTSTREGAYERRRVCLNCGTRWFTAEEFVRVEKKTPYMGSQGSSGPVS